MVSNELPRVKFPLVFYVELSMPLRGFVLYLFILFLTYRAGTEETSVCVHG